MPMNRVQFQKGMSEADFDNLYGTEEKCREALFTWRWPKGFVCPVCGGVEYCIVNTRDLFQCRSCRSQISLISGTIFHATKLPLKVWFRAMYHMTQAKGGISSIELGRRLGVTQKTAWKISHKLMQVMHEREEEKPLSGRVEMDDAYLGGKSHDGKRGRGASGKTPFIAAVETTDDGKPHRLKLKRVAGFNQRAIISVLPSLVQEGSRVITDGLSCFGVIGEQGMEHTMQPTSGKRGVQNSVFKCVNTVLGNVKTAITGTYKAVITKHAQRYLSSFAYRFNRRYDLSTMFARLGYVAVRTPPMPYRLLKLADVGA